MAIANVIPSTSTLGAFFTESVELSGVSFRLDFRFNTRDNHWYIDIFDEDDNPLRRGVKILTNWTMLRGWTDGGRPPGEIGLLRADTDDDIGIDELGETFDLIYLESG